MSINGRYRVGIPTGILILKIENYVSHQPQQLRISMKISITWVPQNREAVVVAVPLENTGRLAGVISHRLQYKLLLLVVPALPGSLHNMPQRPV